MNKEIWIDYPDKLGHLFVEKIIQEKFSNLEILEGALEIAKRDHTARTNEANPDLDLVRFTNSKIIFKYYKPVKVTQKTGFFNGEKMV